jgi:cysteine synthase A
MTPTVARMVAARMGELNYPLKWFCISNMYRYERPQRGRLREFWQLNVDIFGCDTFEADLEVIRSAISLMRAFGAELVLTDGRLGMAGAIQKANELAAEYPDSMIAGQFDNPANPKAHRETTGPEIRNDTDGEVDLFVCGVGTGGTVTGVGEYLKSRYPAIRVVAVEPRTSAFLSTGKAGAHGLQGIGAGFVPKVLNTEIYDEIITVSDGEAYETARMIGKTEGVLVGISSGAAAWAAIELAKRPENKGKKIVVLLPDAGDRYLSTDLFSE